MMSNFDDNFEEAEQTKVTEGTSVKATESEQDVLVRIYPAGVNMGRKFELKDRLITMGRDPSSTIVISSDSVSRKHARLTLEKGKRIITDLQSTNGSYVNDIPVISEVLKHGDQLKIGDTIFKYLVGSDVETAYHEEIYKMTIIDGLTGVFNKRYFMESLERELSRSQRYGRPLSVLMFDIDHFKVVNDTFGHLAGDYVLQALARLISSRARREEIFARFGGEEFIILLPETKYKGALKLAEQLRKRIASFTFVFEGEEIPLTVSIGVTTCVDDSTSDKEFLAKVDEKLYEAKSAGRNCVRG